MTALEARLRGAHHALTPVVDVAREPRWGRVEETYGEDPYLVSRLGIAAVKGFQGDRNFRDKRHVLATLKHFVGHGQPESGMNCAPANVSHARAARDLPLHLQGGAARGRSRDADGLLQRDRRRAFACQQVAAARRAAQGVGLQGIHRFGLLRDLGTGLPARHARPLCGEGQEGIVPRWRWKRA